MCHLCEIRKLLDRADRVIKALREGSPVNTEALAVLLTSVRNDLASYHNREADHDQKAKEILSSTVAEFVIDENTDPNAIAELIRSRVETAMSALRGGSGKLH